MISMRVECDGQWVDFDDAPIAVIDTEGFRFSSPQMMFWWLGGNVPGWQKNCSAAKTNGFLKERR